MAHSLSAYTTNDKVHLSGILTQSDTPSTDGSTPVSSCGSSTPTTESDGCHVPRPPNCFMIFRSEFLALHSDETQTKASKLAGAAWRKLPKERKDHYKELAKDRKEDHARAHPGYKYKPRRSKRGKKADGRKKVKAQINRLDAQSFYEPPPIANPTVPEVLQSLGLVSASVVESNQSFGTNGNEIVFDFAAIQVMGAAPTVYDTAPPSAHPFSRFDISQIEASDAYFPHIATDSGVSVPYNDDSSWMDTLYGFNGSLNNEWDPQSNLISATMDYLDRAADNPLHYLSLPDSLSSMTSDGGAGLFNLFESY